MSSQKGKYIIIEGIDGAGKQTQADLIFKYLQSMNKKVIKQSFPDYESKGCAPVKMYLNGELSKTANEIDAYQCSVLFATDRFCTMKKLYEKIDNDSIIIFDRYVSSNILHQGGKIKDDSELKKFIEWLYNFEFEVMKIPKPDLIIFLAVPPEISLKIIEERNVNKSGEQKDIQESDKEHLKNAYETGIKIAKLLNWEIIDCVDKEKNYLKSRDEIHNLIKNKVNEKLNL